MTVNLGIDKELLAKARRAGAHRSNQETINEALREYVRSRRRPDFKRLFGTIDFRPDWDYKTARRR